MFNLSKAVDDWCNNVVAYDIWDADKIDELKDHLYCIIEAEVKAGCSEQQAFENATQSMGYARNESSEVQERARIVQGVCRVLKKIEGRSSGESPLIIGHAVIWASVMLATAMVINNKETGQSVMMILILGWFASLMTLDGTRRSAKREWACIKRRLNRLFA